ncbi:hypothetical protein KRR38_30105 [Novosphingobium sp. G106]|uniref:hypothetical protein n=1 Tax=Novosphingobium sp. G106 TaxID=2849500 RepID=UPI001C2D29BC|nr:hypothetical protein [Novosphingobium sp. G106]MBV1691817.1 hypothetical protein [Novosphingobium sp. G106]
MRAGCFSAGHSPSHGATQDRWFGTFAHPAHLQAMIPARRQVKVAIILAAVFTAFLALVAGAFPASWLKGLAERKLSAELARPVTIAALERESPFSFTPILRVKGVDIPQAKWAGPGKLASIASLRVRVAVLPAIFGRANPQVLSAGRSRSISCAMPTSA